MNKQNPFLRVSIECPYCSTVSQKAFELQTSMSGMLSTSSSTPEVAHCELEDGGCGLMFVFNPEIIIKTSVLKIVGQQELIDPFELRSRSILKTTLKKEKVNHE